jgi:hypothetical protein
MRRGATVFTLLVSLVLLAGCGRQRAQPPARLPERTAEQAVYDLLDTLNQSPVTAELPPGFTAPAPKDGIVALTGPVDGVPVSPSQPGWRAGLYVLVKGPDFSDLSGLHVFATAADAEVAFRAIEGITQPPTYDTFTPPRVQLPRSVLGGTGGAIGAGEAARGDGGDHYLCGAGRERGRDWLHICPG